MGRKLLNKEERKKKICITISQRVNYELEEMKINKSKLINWLLNEHFNLISHE